MRRALVFLLPFLAACGGADGGRDVSEPEEGRSRGLEGHYQGSEKTRPGDRLCMIEEGDNAARFAFVTLGEGRAACSGLGRAQRSADTLTLTLEGDGECEFEARIEAGRITFPQSVPDGCAYYCSEAASLASRIFDKSAGGLDAARSPRDLVGDPLCR